eukprot:jgi/Bigna1/71639/fgenesh1_pg.16_\
MVKKGHLSGRKDRDWGMQKKRREAGGGSGLGLVLDNVEETTKVKSERKKSSMKKNKVSKRLENLEKSIKNLMLLVKDGSTRLTVNTKQRVNHFRVFSCEATQ